MLTSGTTGTPKGAQRSSPDGLLRDRRRSRQDPVPGRRVDIVAAPLFHSLGFAHAVLELPLGSTLVLRRRFDPEETLQRRSQRHRARCWSSCR